MGPEASRAITRQRIYTRKIERVGGKLQYTVIHTYPHVSEFWKYNPEDFLKQPVYAGVPAVQILLSQTVTR